MLKLGKPLRANATGGLLCTNRAGSKGWLGGRLLAQGQASRGGFV